MKHYACPECGQVLTHAALCPDNDSNDEGTPPTRAELRAQRALAAAEDRSGMNMRTEHED